MIALGENPLLIAAAIHTVPTGFEGVPPPGPGDPGGSDGTITSQYPHSPTGHLLHDRLAYGPESVQVRLGDTEHMMLHLVAIGYHAPGEVFRAARLEVIMLAIFPPVQLSAVPIIRCPDLSASATSNSIGKSSTSIVIMILGVSLWETIVSLGRNFCFP